MGLHRTPNENEEQFIWRLGRMKDSGELDLGWEEIAKLINEEFREDDSEYRNESAYRKPYQQAKRFYEAGVFKDLTSEKYIEIIKEEERKAKLERQKARDEKLELNKWIREHSRDQQIFENIREEIAKLPSIQIHKPLINIEIGEKSGVLCFADTHYGTEFEIKGLGGEIINNYSPEVFEARMEELLTQTVNKALKEGLTKIRVFSLGDELDGILRVSQLRKLRYGVIEATIKYAEYISNWLNRLSEYVFVEFQMAKGNHTELRMLGQPKGTFTEDNMGEVIREFIKLRLQNNPNFKLISNESGLVFDEIQGFNILGIHGEVKNLARALQNFSISYGKTIDILVGGHYHHSYTETVGVNKDVVSVPSIIGIDNYSMSLGKTSNAGATFLIIEEKKGIIEQTTFKFSI